MRSSRTSKLVMKLMLMTWEVRISESFRGDMWAVYFKDWSEKQAYSDEKLRWHHKWANGSWITPFPQHVCNDGDGFKEGWKFVVQYESLLDEDDYKHLKEEISRFQIRLGLLMLLMSLRFLIKWMHTTETVGDAIVPPSIIVISINFITKLEVVDDLLRGFGQSWKSLVVS
ncbi:hypothetical protein KIW84_064172 [Lathyrus oleraceus]|uniref:Uncharacterized protein n=1 Tax=Pisum sativum TaxID=3888 RepID=A0A9D5A5T3_PEA|nr:hypothetical protein KIW84_064172 [Pisum sativum]